LKRGYFIFLHCDENFISYARFTRDKQIVVVVNSGEPIVERDVPVWLAGVPDGEMEEIMITNEKGYSIMPVKYKVENGHMHVNLNAYTAMVLRHNV
jgi:alpha-glucosidase